MAGYNAIMAVLFEGRSYEQIVRRADRKIAGAGGFLSWASFNRHRRTRRSR